MNWERDLEETELECEIPWNLMFQIWRGERDWASNSAHQKLNLVIQSMFVNNNGTHALQIYQ